MNKSIKVVLASIITFFLLPSPSFSQDANFHIYLLFGQSNMEGMGTVAAQDRQTNERVLVLQDQDCSNLNRYYGQWYLAEPPLNRCWAGIGPGDYFGKTMAAGMASEIKIGLVPASVAGTGIALYEKSAPIGRGGYDIPTQFSGGYAWLLDLAQRAQTVGVIKGIIFHQGETNTADPNWKYTVQQIVSDLRNDLGIGNVPFLAGELLYAQYGGCCSSHNPEINQLPGLISNAHVISAEGLAGVDNAHFSSEAYREFGRRYANKMLTLAGGTIPEPEPDPEPEPEPEGQQCNWYGTLFPLCDNQEWGWGWEDSASCIGALTCSDQYGDGGIVD